MKCRISYFSVLFVGDFAAESGSRQSAKRSSIVPKYKKPRCLREKRRVSAELRSGLTHRAGGRELNARESATY